MGRRMFLDSHCWRLLDLRGVARLKDLSAILVSILILIMASSSRALNLHPSNRFAYDPPSWAKSFLCNVPSSGRLKLANLPTPLYKLTPPKSSNAPSILKRLLDLDITLYVKRDDMTGGVETGGNKIRKLEFLLADALANDFRSVMTIGGEQSNHCRATAAASRMVGLKSHLILRTKRADAVQAETDDFGFTGNILFDRIVGSTIYTCTPGEYGRVGSLQLLSKLSEHLTSEDPDCGSPIYKIPVGGSNGIGSWGYVNGVDELLKQWRSSDSNPTLDHVVFASGSGGTAAGITLGMALSHGALNMSENDQKSRENSLSSLPPQVHAIGVCDDPDYFYKFIAGIADEMGLRLPDSVSTEEFVRKHMTAHQGKGLGYAASSPQELAFITEFALETGIALDPVYSGKALYHFLASVLEGDVERFRGKNILFWHTGGALGLFDKVGSLQSPLNTLSPVKRLDVYGRGFDGGIKI